MTILNVIGYIAMLIDHLGLLIFQDDIIFRILGRAALPIFIYSVYSGLNKTNDVINYMKRVFIIAIISQPFYMLLVSNQLNICFTIFFLIFLFSKIYIRYAYYIKILIVVLLFLDITEYGFLSLCLVFLFKIFKGKIKFNMIMLYLLLTSICIYLYGYNYIQYFSTMSLFLIKIKILKYEINLSRFLKYSIYPLHLFFLLIFLYFL
ncbi:hypothetical protein I6G25_11275 (plasmid) [Macrococcoides caseolyticum]|uniref:TraX family protein n=1 Tax=Macrococcoides caseolyticum TaxID=69966 RepID=UPI000CD242EF|nr:hypothetical protein CD152_02895 [Macrococcus caseolyticus]QPT47858.1 hypothetical protein I6G25_11275 [Macrococcus caseolyticus]